MKPTSEDFKPRRDGWYEHVGTWEEVTVGTVLADPAGSRTKRWEVTATAMGDAPIEFGRTLWMRIREQTTGEEHTIPPKMKHTSVTILSQDPRDTTTPPPRPPEDVEAIMLLVRELGAEIMATIDNVTGEVTCPDYDGSFNHHLPGGPGQARKAYLEHLRMGHGLSVDDDIDIADSVRLHGRSHNPKYPEIGKGGFPHRHVPEDLSLFTGKR